MNDVMDLPDTAAVALGQGLAAEQPMVADAAHVRHPRRAQLPTMPRLARINALAHSARGGAPDKLLNLKHFVENPPEVMAMKLTVATPAQQQAVGADLVGIKAVKSPILRKREARMCRPELPVAKPIAITPQGVAVGEPLKRLVDPVAGPISMLIIQPTGFCNLACSYCYLPDKDKKSKLDPELYRQILTSIMDSGYATEDFTIVWHAGEPLTAGKRFFREIFKITDQVNRGRLKLTHSIQTNGMLLDDGWVSLFQEYGARVGVSIDGPAFIHDHHRVGRNNKGTLAKTLKGLEALRRADMPYSVLAVLTDKALEHPMEIAEFFLDLGPQILCFNLEENEGVHLNSTVSDASLHKYRNFMSKLYDTLEGRLEVREFKGLHDRIFRAHFNLRSANTRKDVNTMYRIITVGLDGSFSTFAPELLTQRCGDRDFVIGKFPEDSLQSVRYSPKLLQMHAEIERGKQLCAASCPYNLVCGGGEPSNKLAENGRFETSETMMCRLHVKALADVMADKLEHRYGVGPTRSIKYRMPT